LGRCQRSIPAEKNVIVLSSINEITAAWLTDVLLDSGELPGGECVLDLEVERVGVGRGLLAEVHRVGYRSSGGGGGSVVVKVPAANELRQTADALGLYAREVAFYGRLAAEVPLRTPRVHKADISERSGDFVLVLEDLLELEPADQLAGLSYDEAAAAVEAVAPLHAWGWGRTSAGVPALDSEMTRALYPGFFAAGWACYLSHCEQPDPTLVTAAAAWPDALAWLLGQLGTPVTLCHGDYRADNLFRAADGGLTVVDFQLVHLGCGISDIAYLVSQSTDDLDCDGHRSLVHRYVRALEGEGVCYREDEAWRQYRAAVVFHLVEAVVATLSWPSLVPRGRALVLRLVERAAAAMATTEALDVLPPSVLAVRG
jgi:hypothetical protein